MTTKRRESHVGQNKVQSDLVHFNYCPKVGVCVFFFFFSHRTPSRIRRQPRDPPPSWIRRQPRDTHDTRDPYKKRRSEGGRSNERKCNPTRGLCPVWIQRGSSEGYLLPRDVSPNFRETPLSHDRRPEVRHPGTPWTSSSEEVTGPLGPRSTVVGTVPYLRTTFDHRKGSRGQRTIHS